MEMSKEIDKKRLYSILYLVCFVLLINSLPFSLFIKDEVVLFIINLVVKSVSIFYILRYIKKENLNKLKLEKFKNSNLKLLPFLLLCCSNFIVVLIQNSNMKEINFFNIFSGFIISIGVAIVEELLFRSQVLEEFLKNNNKFKSILYSSIVFGMIHLLNISSLSSIPTVLVQVVYSFFLGFILGFIYLKSKNIIYPIIFHFLFNFLNDILVIELFKLKWDITFFIVNIVIGIVLVLYMVLILITERRDENVT